MAVSYVGAGTFTAGTGASTPPIPAGAVAGDIMVLLCETSNAVIVNDAALQSAGWTPFSSSPQGTGSGTTATRLTSYWKRHTGTESNPALGDSGDHTGGIVMVFRGCKASGSPIDADAGSVAASASTSVSCPTITTTGADRMVVAAVAWSTDSASAQTSSWTNANLTGLTERQDSGSTAGNGGGISVATGVMATAGAVGATTATLATSSVQGRIQFALIPEPIADGDYTVTAYDSGSNYAQKSTWPPTTTDYVGDDDGGSTIYVSRNLSGGTYTVDTAYLLFDLSSLSGGSPVSAAKLRVYLKAKSDNDARYGIRAEVYDFGGTSDSSDWVAEVTSPVAATSLLSATAASNYIEMDLTDLTAVSALGVVGFRITMATTGTAAPSAVNTAQLGSHTDTNKPQLVVTLTSGGGTTPVGVNRTAAWGVRTPVPRTRTTVWGVRSRTQRSRTVSWGVRGLTSRTRTVVWQARSAATRSRICVWGVRAVVTRSRTVAWGARRTITDGGTVVWGARGAATRTRTVAWGVRGAITDGGTVTWGVRRTITDGGTVVWGVRTLITDGGTIAWRVRAGVADGGIIAWGVRSSITRSRTAAWGVRSLVSSTGTVAWEVESDSPTVTIGGTILWGVRARVTRGRTASWGVLGRAQRTRTVSWSVRARTARTRVVSWGVRGRAQRTRTTVWGVRARAAKGATVAWAAHVTVGRTRTSVWGVRGTLQFGRTVAWGVTVGVATSRIVVWQGPLATAATSATAVWLVRAPTRKSGTVVWAFQRVSGKTLSGKLIPTGVRGELRRTGFGGTIVPSGMQGKTEE